MVEFSRSTAIPHLEARRSCQENSCYRPHSHDAFSIGLIDEGLSVFTGPFGNSIRLRPLDVIVIAADQVHQCNPYSGRWLYRMIHMDQHWVADLSPNGAADGLLSGTTVLRRPDLHQLVTEWSDLIFADEPPERIESGFRALVGELGAAVPEQLVVSETDPVLLDRLRPVLSRLRFDESNPGLEELAELVDMTKYQLVRAVKSVTGLAPLAWRQNARIAQARHRLRNGDPIADTAHALGFTDQSHFHRVFRAHVATSPGSYRA
ncbi:MAG: AraC family transcriptional regulator [Yaniella sp.]|uniref:helix-turn-helix domain-containing protein n=1 Tax=Yaniella sp. TaxID=2773929 RepID=UPI00264A2DD5|nr:AraC family transcriptional regulator [Yaniella sp.]MDN6173766.1 AraC family transcriptional regulator [Yaniella sp.]MDN6758272.1 AraC family transcriptional regulator [Yaniella sp.]